MIVVGYLRLSRDEDKENYSSIESQQDIIREYAKKHNWKVSKFYIDDNYSGYTFNRPAFNELIEDVENDRVDIIIAKDLSRIGRHNAKMLLFIESIQQKGKRILLPEEGRGYDSNNDDDEILGIKTWYNERYVKDISRKIKSNMRAKQKKGELVMGNHYGYLKDEKNKAKLYVDENIRPIIELIFKLYIDGLGYKKICDVLNEKKYLTPSQYLKERHANNGRVFKNTVSDKWQTHNIQRIIQNPLYAGTLTTHKKENKHVKGKQQLVNKEDNFVFEDHHELIISKEDFMLAQNINKKRVSIKEQNGIQYSNYKNNSKYDYIFSSFIYCGDCGYSMTGLNLRKKPKVTRGYNCVQYTKYGLNRCINHAIKEDELLMSFKNYLIDKRDKFLDMLNSYNFEESKKDINKKLNVYKKELSNIEEELKILFNQKIKDLIRESNEEFKRIIESSYEQLENDKKNKIKELTFKIKDLEKKNEEEMKIKLKTTIDIFNNIINKDKPERKHLELILNKITIFKDGSIEVELKPDIKELTEDK